MPQENVEVVRRAISAYNARDLEALNDLNAPDVEADWSESLGLQQGIYRGRDEVLAFFREFFDSFQEIEILAESFIEQDDVVIVPTFSRFVGRQSLETTARATLVFHVRNGQVAHLRLHQ